MRKGRRLYRGVFFGAGPWSVWVSRLLVRWTGERLLVLRRAAVVLSVGLGAATWAWTSALGVPRASGLAVAAGAVLLSTGLWTLDNPYGLWSRVGAVVALAAPLGLDDRWVAGLVAAAGLAVALLGKYTLGLAALPGMVTVAVTTETATGAATGVLLGGLLAAGGYAAEARGGVGRAMAARLLRNKRTFVATGGSGFLAGWRSMTGRPPAQSVLEWRVAWIAFALTAASGLLVAAGAVDAVVAGAGREAAALLGLAVVAVAALYPRADEVHVRCAVPLWTAPAVVAADRLADGLGLAWAVLLALLGLVSAVLAVAERRHARPVAASGTPFDGVNAWPWDLGELQAGGDELRRLTRGTVFLLRPDAAVWYLATGLRNPTPYDYPLASTFGPTGQRQLADNLAAGRVPCCCWVPAHAGALTPTELEACAASLPVVAQTRVGSLVAAR